MRRCAWWVSVSGLLLPSLVVPVFAQLTTVPVVGDVSGLVAFVQDPALPETFYLVQRSGKILVLQRGSMLEAPLLDLSDHIRVEAEEGLLGLAFFPNAASGWFFVHFTNVDGHAVVARFTRAPDRPAVVPGSRLDLLWPSGLRVIEQPSSRHKGGHLAFGPDGFLYIGLGDGGGANDAFNNAQNPNSLLGKMLRIDVNVDPSDVKGYRVPAANPFVGQPTFGEIWSFGLRNPWAYSFDNAALGGTGALVVADVGQSAREEVDYEPGGLGGRNYGWPIREGSTTVLGTTPPPPAFLPLTDPLFDYGRDVGQAVIGGYVYRGAALPPPFRGRYFVGDFRSGRVASVGLNVNPQTRNAVVVDGLDHTAQIGGEGIVGFAEDLGGELYVVRFSGPVAVAKIVVDTSGPPAAPRNLTAHIADTNVQLSWTPPVSGAPTEYQLEVGSTSGASDLLVTRLPGAPTTVAATNVAQGQYFVRVRGVNFAGIGAASDEAVVFVGCTSVPAAPTSLSHLVIGNVVALAWDGVPGASGYRLEAGTAPPRDDIVIVPLPSTPPGIVTPAPPGTYHVTVRAQNACGQSAPSNQIVVVVP